MVTRVFTRVAQKIQIFDFAQKLSETRFSQTGFFYPKRIFKPDFVFLGVQFFTGLKTGLKPDRIKNRFFIPKKIRLPLG